MVPATHESNTAFLSHTIAIQLKSKLLNVSWVGDKNFQENTDRNMKKNPHGKWRSNINHLTAAIGRGGHE